MPEEPPNEPSKALMLAYLEAEARHHTELRLYFRSPDEPERQIAPLTPDALPRLRALPQDVERTHRAWLNAIGV